MFKQQDGHHAKPAIAFQHIPIPEYMELWNYHMTYGTLQDEGIRLVLRRTMNLTRIK
jgi:hypothetical protein